MDDVKIKVIDSDKLVNAILEGSYDVNLSTVMALGAVTCGTKDLPPAQSEPIRINLNDSIKVKLTDWGKEIYYHKYDRVNRIAGREICKPKFPKEDENGYCD